MRYLRFLAVALAAAAAAAPIPPTLVERWYSRGLYPELQLAITTASSLVPVALMDVAVLIILVAASAGLAARWKERGFFAALRWSVVTFVVACAVLYLWFLLFWGLNYRRVPLEQKLAYDPSRIGRERALELGRLAVDEANLLQPSGHAPVDQRALSSAFAEVLRRLGALKPTQIAQPKWSLVMWYFRAASIDGMTDPFFLEIVLHPDLLPFERPFVLAHEWAHLAGYADESEANFVAWLTCVTASPAAQYSGWLSAYQHLTSALPREDRRDLRERLSAAVARDLADARLRAARANPVVTSAARQAYDRYLRANRIEEGIANYSAVARLMLGTTFDKDWRPRLRR